MRPTRTVLTHLGTVDGGSRHSLFKADEVLEQNSHPTHHYTLQRSGTWHVSVYVHGGACRAIVEGSRGS